MAESVYKKTKNESIERTIVFIHGNSSSSNVFKSIFDSDLNYHLLAIDLPGHGLSAHSNREDSYSIDRFKKEIIRAIDLSRPVILVGHSLGGHLAMEISHVITNLAGLVIIGAPPVENPLNLAEAFLPNPLAAAFYSAEVTENTLDKLLSSVVFDESAVPSIKHDFLKTDPQVRVSLAANLSASDVFKDQSKIFIHLNCPRLIIHGKNDSMVNLTYLLKVCDESQGEVELITLENCGHYPSLERPNVFLRTLDAFAKKSFQ